jgi:eukaryotic-like serine/threonine-protein kinase
MQPERWARIEEVLHLAIDCAPADRAALLDSVCGGDDGLRREVESLLAMEDAGFTGSSAFGDGMKLLERRIEKLDQQRSIGSYRILREIGRGGMGAVYQAARADDAFEKIVAIKVIRRGLDTEELIDRFRAERQILAMLDHPNITRLLDAGSTDDGLPYFVMEYIEGEPIDVYCESRGLSIDQRLKLFQNVCAAVSYAHRNLVIHRDIKPGNVLVTKDGVPRLLDFGIAKLLDPGLNSEVTLTALHPLTPEYASPEQVRGGPVTTATDVYSLGVLLYKLLTGLRPYSGPLSSPAEIVRSICEEEPSRPSASVSRDRRLARRLQGDLDNIVLMALRKDPRRRYSSVEQFSEDIARHQDGLPVIARADTATYRAGKFIRRHKVGVAGTALLIAVLAAGIAATTWQARRAAAERDRARIETAKAGRINAFLQDMLAYSSPSYDSPNASKDKDAKVSEVLEQAAKRAESELADQPEILAEVQRDIGGVYVTQGRVDQAEPLLRSALEKFKKLYGAESPEIVVVGNALANCLLIKGDHASAESLFRVNIEIGRKAARRGYADPKPLAYSLGGLGGMLDRQGDNSAEPYLHEALQYASGFQGKDRAFVAMLYNNLGHIAFRKGDLMESERLGRAAIDEYRHLPPGTYVEMAVSLSNLGAVLIRQRRFAEAEPFVREGLDLRRRILGDSHPDTAMGWYRLSDLLYSEGDYSRAEQAARMSLEVFRRALAKPENDLVFANPLTELGMILNKSGRPQEAEKPLREALQIRTHLLAPGNQLIAATQAALGASLLAQRRYMEAEPLLAASYEIFQSTGGEQDPRAQEISRSLNEARRHRGGPSTRTVRRQ